MLALSVRLLLLLQLTRLLPSIDPINLSVHVFDKVLYDLDPLDDLVLENAHAIVYRLTTTTLNEDGIVIFSIETFAGRHPNTVAAVQVLINGPMKSLAYLVSRVVVAVNSSAPISIVVKVNVVITTTGTITTSECTSVIVFNGRAHSCNPSKARVSSRH
jgi:hypothetical protein